MGKYLFKFHPALTLGCTAGARTTTAALGAVQDAVAVSYTHLDVYKRQSLAAVPLTLVNGTTSVCVKSQTK